MKIKITLFTLLLVSISAFAQDKSFDFLKDKSETKIIYDRVFGISNATKIKLEDISTNYFLQVYNEMQRADFNERLPKIEIIKEKANLGFAQKQIPLSLLITDFESVKLSEIDSNYPFEKHSVNLLGALLQKSKTNQVDFILKNDLIFNTTNRTVNSVSVNYNNSKNWKSVLIDQTFRINFTENGKQIIRFKIALSTGEIIEQSIVFNIENQNLGASNKNDSNVTNAVTTISSAIPYQGYGETAAFLGQGEYDVYLDTTDGILDKPIFLLDGFDPGDTRNTAAIYSLLNYGTTGQNLGDIVRAQGYDIVVLNFPTYTRPGTTTVIDGGVDYIQRNAMILVALINQINAQKVGTEKNVIIGPSMGGLIARYALRYMETNSLNSDTRLYLSFDSPHLGANVPIGFQHLFNYMAYGPLGDVTVQGIVDGLLKSPAAKEMLIDHFQGHLQAGSATEFNTASASLVPTGAPNFRTAFQTELNTLGFPTTTRNISIANGAGNGTMTGTPDMVVMGHTFNITPTQRAIIDLRFTPLANVTNDVSRFRAQTNLFIWFTVYESLAKSKSPTFTNGLDSAPGGRFDLTALGSSFGSNALLTEFFTNLNILYFDFIPTLSSMAVSSSTNLYSNVNAASTTPFAASYIPTTNENHITLTPANVAFALNEILNPVLSTPIAENLNSLWVKNPVGNSLEINSSYTIESATIHLTDILGKTIYQLKNQTINETLEIPVSLSKGVYLISIGTENGSITKKIVKN
ncbi:T9SS type A sorting domain-containing protein [Flavobacterium sp.]|uniref:T9SS type A sorting domain-containing protein n=1 Tax=Flavobacterium sp. TaxID=239 RepID=UPI002488A527|nr:T9SS type A sorting domain-containing protein [Flavobacterium sp.]MDI1316407.1 T9SS type A sorting domain-containing protein [Flavobacterium sp.]